MCTITAYIIPFCIVFPYCLSGLIPKELGELGVITELYLSKNQLQGEEKRRKKNYTDHERLHLIEFSGWVSSGVSYR